MYSGAAACKMAPCLVFRSRTYLLTPMLCCVAEPSKRINPCRSTCSPGLSKRPLHPHLTRFWNAQGAVRVGRSPWLMPSTRCGRTVLVVDASVLVVALVDDGTDGDLVRTRLRDERLVAPELIDLEVLSVVRRQASLGALDDRRACMALRDLLEIPVRRARTRPWSRGAGSFETT